MKKRLVFAAFSFSAIFLIMVSSVFAGGKKEKAQPEVNANVNIPGSEPQSGEKKSEVVPITVIQNPKIKSSYVKESPGGSPVKFHEVWGYVMQDEEQKFDPATMPLTDLCYFSVDINSYGEASAIPDIKKIKNFKGRKHLVFTSWGRALTHMVLNPEFGCRNRLLNVIETAAKDYDGIQIDFENVPYRDRKHYQTFLKDIRKRIGQEKWLTVALAARTKDIVDDIYPYKEIEPLVDRILVMAYDEHWSTSKPGPVASIEWCSRVADYCVKTLPNKKLIMGLPFYGRSWQDTSYSKAWIFKSVNRILGEKNITNVDRDSANGIPHFEFDATVHVTGYFDDTYSLVKRARMYQEKGVTRIGFWRIGQEDPDFWPWLGLN